MNGKWKDKKLSASFYRLAAVWWLSILGINFQLKLHLITKDEVIQKSIIHFSTHSFRNNVLFEFACVRLGIFWKLRINYGNKSITFAKNNIHCMPLSLFCIEMTNIIYFCANIEFLIYKRIETCCCMSRLLTQKYEEFFWPCLTLIFYANHPSKGKQNIKLAKNMDT